MNEAARHEDARAADGRRAAPDPPSPAGPPLVDRLRARLAVPLESLLPGPDALVDWPGPLLPFQIEGVHALVECKAVLLADDMGLGKTIQAAAAIRVLCLRREIERVLLVVLASLREQWRRELARWAPELRTITIQGTPSDRSWQWATDSHITIVSYETLRADCTDNPQSAPLRREWDVVVLDEAQKIKSSSSELARACKRLPRDRSWALTGTPLENSVDDLRSILDFVDPASEVADGRPSELLLDRHRRVQLRRRKADVLADLPPKQTVTVALDMLPTQRQSYERAEREGVLQLEQRGAELRIQHVLELILRLKQIANFCPVSRESAKLADIENRLEVLEAEGHRALIFSQFTDDKFGVVALANRLERFRPLAFTGSMSTAERSQVIDRFRRDDRHRVLVLSLRAGGVGLNLQEASYVFHLDRWWNPAVERQAEDRSHRMGQTLPVSVYKYILSDTIEERIEQIIAEKQQLFDELVDDVTIDIGKAMNRDELFGLFDLEVPTSERDRASTPRTDGVGFELRCADVLQGMGWHVEHTARSRDGGVDLIAERTDALGIEQRLFVQCKDHARPVGVDVVRELLGVVPPGENVRPVLAASSGVTADAAALAELRGVIVWDGDKLDQFAAQGASDG